MVSPFAPKIPNCTETTTDMVYDKAESVYGKPLPYNIEERLAQELYGEEPMNIIKKTRRKTRTKR